MEKKYVIVTDATCDLTAEYVNEKNIEVMGMRFTIDGKEYMHYLDGRELSYEDFYSKLRVLKKASTTQLNIEMVKSVYEKFIKDGYDILNICFSSGLSGGYNACRLAREEILEEYKDANIVVIDSKCAAPGEGLLVYYADLFKSQGLTLEENAKKITELIPRLAHWFTVSDIDMLRKGGRLSGASAFVAKTLKIKPVLHVNDEGKLITRFKKIGRKSAIKEIVNQFDQTVDKSYNKIYIGHADCLDDAIELKKIIEEKGNYDVEITYIGPVIAAHAGPDTLALFFIASHR